MLIIPLIYLKNGKALRPVDTNSTWFLEDPKALAHYFIQQGAEALYINDLNVATSGKGENFGVIQAIQKELKTKLWVTGNFRSLSAVEGYTEIGVEKVVLAGSAYQDPKLLQETSQKFHQRMAVVVEVKNKHVVIPGLIAPSHKTANDYATRFEEEGIAALCYADTSPQLDDENYKALKDFCNRTKVPILALFDILEMQHLQKLFDCESSGLMGAVIGKPLYENRIDLHSAISFVNDLAAASNQETTLHPE